MVHYLSAASNATAVSLDGSWFSWASIAALVLRRTAPPPPAVDVLKAIEPLPKSLETPRQSEGKNVEVQDQFCEDVPHLWSAFVDTFADFAVGGQVISSSNTALRRFTASENHPTEEDERPIAAENTCANDDSGATCSGSTQSVCRPSPTGSPSGEYLWGPEATILPPVERLVAIGDLHGDLQKARQALQVAGVMDEQDQWIGGKTVVVQVGDQLDRGNQELAVLFLLERLGRDARRAGGEVHVLNGNHEAMNVAGRFTYATPEALGEFQRWAAWQAAGRWLKRAVGGQGWLGEAGRDPLRDVPEKVAQEARARFAALRQGGPICSRFFAQHPTVLVVGGTVFAHGGVLPNHVHLGLERMNAEARDWLLGNVNGEHTAPESLKSSQTSIVWSRHYSHRNEKSCDCDMLKEALAAVPGGGARRMVVGHTIQQPMGINGACEGRVFRVDVGMSEGCYNAAPEVLEILQDKEVRVLSRHKPPVVLHKGEPSMDLGLKDLVREDSATVET